MDHHFIKLIKNIKKIWKTHGFNCYSQFETVILLETSKWQKNPDNDPKQQYFIELLQRIRNGIFDEKSEKDWKFLLERKRLLDRFDEFKDAKCC